MLAKQLGKFFKKFKGKGQNKPHVKNGGGATIQKQKGTPSQYDQNPADFKHKGVQCRECGGYGHIRADCENLKNKGQKSLTITWSDEEVEDEQDTEITSNYVPFTGMLSTAEPVNDEAIEEQDDQSEYDVLYNKWIHLLEINQDLIHEKSTLEAFCTDLEIKNNDLHQKMTEYKELENKFRLELEQYNCGNK